MKSCPRSSTLSYSIDVMERYCLSPLNQIYQILYRCVHRAQESQLSYTVSQKCMDGSVGSASSVSMCFTH